MVRGDPREGFFLGVHLGGLISTGRGHPLPSISSSDRLAVLMDVTVVEVAQGGLTGAYRILKQWVLLTYKSCPLRSI